MIPTDLAARLRLMAESIVNPVSPVRGISADLPELPVGQRFVARVENAQPDGTFRALVAGRSLTLALPQPAKPGDTLDLIVTARTPNLIIAERAGNAPARPAPSTSVPPAAATVSVSASPDTATTPAPALSRAGRIISTLLSSGENRTPQPPTITRAAPLLPEPMLQAARIAPALQQVVTESGLFYESHQAQWVAGRYPAEALVREPQARHARPQRAPDVALVANPAEDTTETGLPKGGEPVAARSAPASATSLPAELQALVHQQLDAFATQHIVWRGEVWPGQALHWEIAADEQQRENSGEETAEQWTTSLGLTLPRLGEVNVVLRLSPAKVSLHMTASTGAPALQQGLAELSTSFEAAGLPPLSAIVDSHEPA